MFSRQNALQVFTKQEVFIRQILSGETPTGDAKKSRAGGGFTPQPIEISQINEKEYSNHDS